MSETETTDAAAETADTRDRRIVIYTGQFATNTWERLEPAELPALLDVTYESMSKNHERECSLTGYQYDPAGALFRVEIKVTREHPAPTPFKPEKNN